MDEILSFGEVPIPVLEYCTGLVGRLSGLLGDALVAVYLYGSATVGDFDPRSSDLDLLLVVQGSLGPSFKSGLTRLLWDTAPMVPARGMECWVVTSEMVASVSGIGHYELMVNTHPQEPMTLDGALHPGEFPMVDIDLVRDTGISVFGPHPRELIAEVPRAVVLASMVAVLKTEAPDSSESYGVLNAARSFAYLRTGQHLSKLAGARWVLEQSSPPPVVEQAVQALLGLVPDRPLTGPGRRYVEEVIRQLEREI